MTLSFNSVIELCTLVFSYRGIKWLFGGLSPHKSPRELWGLILDTNMAFYTHIYVICTHKVPVLCTK